jgi:hypothetical protein
MVGRPGYGSKITEVDADEIRLRYWAGLSGPKLAKEFGVSNTVIYKILNKEVWVFLRGRNNFG